MNRHNESGKASFLAVIVSQGWCRTSTIEGETEFSAFLKRWKGIRYMKFWSEINSQLKPISSTSSFYNKIIGLPNFFRRGPKMLKILMQIDINRVNAVQQLLSITVLLCTKTRRINPEFSDFCSLCDVMILTRQGTDFMNQNKQILHRPTAT